MADIPQITEYQAVVAMSSHGKRSQFREGSRSRGSKERPDGRTSNQIADVASVMGIPTAELTPNVEEALTLILNEMDKIRWELDVSQERESRLQELADTHASLPVLNRRALYSQLVRLGEHAARTETQSFLVLVSIRNLGDLRQRLGLAAREVALDRVVEFLTSKVRDIDLVGELGGGEFAIIRNVTTEEDTVTLAASLVSEVSEIVIHEDETSVQLAAGYGISSLRPENSAEQSMAAADADLRSRD